MSKYIEIVKIFFKAQLVWRFDVAMNVIFTVTKILFAYVLWGAIYQQNETIAGFTFPMMLTYYIISSFLSQIEMSGGVSTEISECIKNGTFSKYMVIPIDTRSYFIAQTIGRMSFYITFNFLAAVTWVVVFGIQFTVITNLVTIFYAIIMVILGLLFMIQLNYFLGILAFKFVEIRFFLLFKDNIVSFLTGTLVPLVFLPQAFVSVLRFFPFYYVTYLPSMLLIGKNENQAFTGVITLAAWLISFTLLNRFVYRKLRVVYDGVGI